MSVYDPEPEEEPLPDTVMGMGIEAGIKARLLWPGGVLVDTEYCDYSEAIEGTKALIADPTVPAIFEAALVHHGVLIRIDCLERLPDGRWRLNEVKSSTRVKDEHLEELALQTHVVVGSGLELADVHLVHIDYRYTRGEEIDWDALFVRVDVSESLLPGVPERIANMHLVLSSREAPDIRPSRHCFQPHDCEILAALHRQEAEGLGISHTADLILRLRQVGGLQCHLDAECAERLSVEPETKTYRRCCQVEEDMAVTRIGGNAAVADTSCRLPRF